MAVSLPISSWIAGSVHLKLCTPSGLIVTAPCSGAELHGIFWAPGQIKELILKQFGDPYIMVDGGFSVLDSAEFLI